MTGKGFTSSGHARLRAASAAVAPVAAALAATAALFGGVVAGPAAAQDSDVVLGSPSYAPLGGGWGTVQPSSVSNGGVPSGILTDIRWRGWGGEVATGVARASLYKPGGGYYAKGGRALLRASQIGTCPGETARAYTVLEVRVPTWPGGAPGAWFKWSGTRTICDYADKDPLHEHPRWPGYCGYTGEYGQEGQATSINAYRVGCRRAKAVVLRSRRLVSPSPSFGPRKSCGAKGCRVRIRGFRCSFQPIRTEDLPELVQRVTCRRGGGTITWLYKRYYD